MENIIRNILRFGIVSFYPLIIIGFFILILRRKDLLNVVKKHYKSIILNALIISIITIISLIVFFKLEDMIYSYDYAGHWVRSLEMRDLFFTNPLQILPKLYQSMNHSDYSYLPSVILLPITIINSSYGFFCIGNYIMFILPTIILLQILYFMYFNKYKLLPIFIYIAFYPLYFGLFFGEVDCSGLFFVTISLLFLFLTPIKDIKYSEIISINISTLMLLFLRRYYLFYIAIMYILFLIRVLIHYFKKEKNNKLLLYALSSGIFALIIIILFFRPYMFNVLNNNFNEAYEVYNRNNKISALLNYFSLISFVFIGNSVYQLYKQKREIALYLPLMVIMICLLFWRTQAFEYHHYNLITIPMLFLFSNGIIYFLNNYKKISVAFICLLIFQSSNIYLNIIPNSIPIFTTLRKQPEVFWGTDKFKELSYYLADLTKGEGQSIFMATGSSIFNYDLLQNANLPDISNRPKFDTKTFDLRDGFPKDLEHIRYVIVSDPIQYINKDYQHMFDVISNAITKNTIVSTIYTPISTFKIDYLNVVVYEKTGDFSPAIKQYFYDEMLKFYPDKSEFFSYILD